MMQQAEANQISENTDSVVQLFNGGITFHIFSISSHSGNVEGNRQD
jgi:hypothetical protein